MARIILGTTFSVEEADVPESYYLVMTREYNEGSQVWEESNIIGDIDLNDTIPEMDLALSCDVLGDYPNVAEYTQMLEFLKQWYKDINLAY